MIDDRNTAAEEVARVNNRDLQVAVNYLQALEIHARDQYDEPQWTLTKDGIGFAPLGNIMAIAAPMKAGKTWLMQILSGAVLRGEYMGLQCPMEEARVMWFDTEQDKFDTQMILRRMQQICGWSHEEDNERFKIFSLRDFKRQDETQSMAVNRMQLIKAAVEWYRPQVVMVDGIRDLLDDFNDLQESARVVQDFMSLTSEYGCAIWNVLHVNPNSEKMRGHLGTELQNKVTDIFSVEKKKAGTEVTFKVTQTAARHRDIDSFTFRIDDGPRYSIPVMVGSDEAVAFDASLAEELNAMMAKYVPAMGATSYTALRNAIKAGERIRTSKAEKAISDAMGAGVIERIIGGKIRLKAHADGIQKNDDDEMPF